MTWMTYVLPWFIGAAAAAQEPVDVEQGRFLAESWCSSCHQTEGRPITRLDQFAPAFHAIANQPATTELSLRAFLMSPHPTMPNIRLTHEQLDDLIAYLLSLKER